MHDGRSLDHGGDLGVAISRFGGDRSEWIDLSTGINRVSWPIPSLSAEVWRDLPSAAARDACSNAARRAYRVAADAAILPVAGAQAAIQHLPRLRRPGRAAVLSPTYNEHASAFAAEQWRVEEVTTLDALRGADTAIVVNPNNPDGRRSEPGALLDIAGTVGLLVVDESFADIDPDVSLCAQAGRDGLLILRSFGKFYGLAGLRLGFAIGACDDVARLQALDGPWPVSGPALAIGAAALGDDAWVGATHARLAADADRLDRLVAQVGWRSVGGTSLFRLYDVGDAAAAQQRLGRARVWSRRFPWSTNFVRLGLPGGEVEWRRLAHALEG
ncbi:threonine-phosphate decarboxylase CobD [Rubrimonas cliftonensis]|uniref:threonine-phosphate decarboxylase n=1 Tax=Rubrimonas cliftonensis TaxID=89524 RepID=A0A1H4FZA4_9RHOB|nr:threonine-phosphate decarboxylase CobD [Rubrimonas cliftonensis]SEB01802.1 L-threonine O-3-phosphate decarboxylase [Rubrimonas cliftonensis]